MVLPWSPLDELPRYLDDGAVVLERRAHQASRVSLGRRSEVLGPLERLRAEVLVKRYLRATRKAESDSSQRRIDKAERLLAKVVARLYRRARAPATRNMDRARFTDVESAVKGWGVGALFEDMFIFPPAFASKFALVLLPHGTNVPKKGKFGSELAFLALLCRLSGRSFETLESIFGVSYTTLVQHVNAALDIISRATDHLLHVEAAARQFSGRSEYYGKCIRRWIKDTFGRVDAMHQYFLPFRSIVDGLRQDVCRPSDYLLQGIAYSGYTKSHGLLYGIYVLPDGMIMALTPALSGRHCDSQFITPEDAVALGYYNLPALADAAFVYKEHCVIPLPKRKKLSNPARNEHGLTKEDCAIASSARIAVEHTIGHFKKLFPLPFTPVSNKLLISNPERLVRVCGIIYNLHVSEYGAEPTLMFKCEPPSGMSWLSGESL